MASLTPEWPAELRDELGGEEEIPLDSVIKVGDLPDGGSIFDIVGTDESEDDMELSSEDDFYANLAEKIQTSTLNKLASNLLEAIGRDKESRKDWEKTISLGMSYLGLKIEEFKSTPRDYSSAAIDSTLMTAVVNTFSIAQAELLPSAGPAKNKILGDPSPELEDKAEKVTNFINHFLTGIDKEYYSDFYQLLMFIICTGSGFKKVARDPISNQPKPIIIRPQDLIVDTNCSSILSSSRVTYQYTLTKKEIILRQRAGTFIDFPIEAVADEDDEDSSVDESINKIDGVQKEVDDEDPELWFYETDVDLYSDDIPGKYRQFGEEDSKIPRPYKVTTFKNSKTIVGITRNWKEGDENFDKDDEYVQYNYLPGFGIYGMGLFHTLGQSAIVATTILRQNIDAGTAKIFPGGMIKAGLKMEDNVKSPGPGEFVRVETADPGPLENNLMLMPYPGPLADAISILEIVKRDAGRLSAVIDNQVPDGATNTAAMTTLITAEVANRNLSTVLRSLHNSITKELSLLFNVFKDNFEEGVPYNFATPGANYVITKEDFDENIILVPAADPNILTSAHRLMIEEVVMKLSQAAPDLFDKRAVYKRTLMAMKVDNIDQIMPPEQEAVPLDPVTENMNLIMGKPAIAGIHQDHKSHMIVHGVELAKPDLDPMTKARFEEHQKQHMAFDFLVEMQMAMGMQMPDAQMLQDPQVQNEIALRAAQAVQQMMAQQQQAQQQPQMDQNTVLMAQIEQEREASHLKYDSDMKRIELERFKIERQTETEAFKTQMEFEKEMTKTDAEKEIAEERNETAIQVAEMKQKGV